MYKDTIIKYIQFSQILTGGAILREFADLYGSYRLQGRQSTWQYRFWQLPWETSLLSDYDVSN